MAIEPDVLPEGRILLVGGVSVLVLVVAALVAVVWARATGGGPAHDDPGIDDVPLRLGPVEARMFSGERQPPDLPVGYGWVRPELGEVRVPVGDAIRWVAEGMRPIGAPPAEAP